MTVTPFRSSVLPDRHGFFTRQGGVSEGPYASLNCGLLSGDLRTNVFENRARAARFLKGDPAMLLGLTQVHGVRVITVREAWAFGEGPQADAMVTNQPGFLLGVVTADCAPVLLADPCAGVIGAAHAGWPGASAGILEETIAAMKRLGARRDSISAAIGPCIQRDSYEVGADMREIVLSRHPDDSRFFHPGQRDGHWQFDLPACCAARLAAAGVKADIITMDTVSDETRFFSHRRRVLAGGGIIGHHISIIGL